MTKKIVIIDYGVGNLRSVARAVEFCGAIPVLTNDIDEIRSAERLILPGVGAFASCIGALKECGLYAPLKQIMEHDLERPMLGICVGMQMLMDGSEEFGTTKGFGLIPGWVRSLPNTDVDGVNVKIPHIGWNRLEPPFEGAWADSPLNSVEPGSACYFVHSFAVVPEHKEHALANCTYGGKVFCAAVRKGNIFGMQFHPEKSGKLGLSILANFLQI